MEACISARRVRAARHARPAGGLQGADGKRALADGYTAEEVQLPAVAGTLYVRNQSTAARWAAALAAAVWRWRRRWRWP